MTSSFFLFLSTRFYTPHPSPSLSPFLLSPSKHKDKTWSNTFAPLDNPGYRNCFSLTIMAATASQQVPHVFLMKDNTSPMQRYNVFTMCLCFHLNIRWSCPKIRPCKIPFLRLHQHIVLGDPSNQNAVLPSPSHYRLPSPGTLFWMSNWILPWTRTRMNQVPQVYPQHATATRVIGTSPQHDDRAYILTQVQQQIQ